MNNILLTLLVAMPLCGMDTKEEHKTNGAGSKKFNFAASKPATPEKSSHQKISDATQAFNVLTKSEKASAAQDMARSMSPRTLVAIAEQFLKTALMDSKKFPQNTTNNLMD